MSWCKYLGNESMRPSGDSCAAATESAFERVREWVLKRRIFRHVSAWRALAVYRGRMTRGSDGSDTWQS